jgi:hypothetical protein
VARPQPPLLPRTPHLVRLSATHGLDLRLDRRHARHLLACAEARVIADGLLLVEQRVEGRGELARQLLAADDWHAAVARGRLANRHQRLDARPLRHPWQRGRPERV